MMQFALNPHDTISLVHTDITTLNNIWMCNHTDLLFSQTQLGGLFTRYCRIYANGPLVVSHKLYCTSRNVTKSLRCHHIHFSYHILC